MEPGIPALFQEERERGRERERGEERERERERERENHWRGGDSVYILPSRTRRKPPPQRTKRLRGGVHPARKGEATPLGGVPL